MQKLRRKIQESTGSLSLEMVIVTMIMFPIIVSLIIGSYSYFAITSENTNLNFKAGRVVSTTGCSVTKLQSTMPTSSTFNGYTIIVNEGATSQTIQNGTAGTISITCQAASGKGDEFEVYSSMDAGQNVFVRFFPDMAARKAIYVQEVSE